MVNSKIYPNVEIGPGAEIGEFVTIGEPPGGVEPGQLKTVIGSNAQIRSNSVIYAGNVIGDNFQTGHGILIREHNVIGDNVKVWSQAIIYHHIRIANNVVIHMGAAISEYSQVEEDVFIGPRALFTSVLHPGCPKAKECWKGPTVKKGAIVGGNVVIMPDTSIGAYAIVSAGSVVTKPVPDRTIVFGNPARKVGDTFNSLTCPYGLIDKPYKEEVLNDKMTASTLNV